MDIGKIAYHMALSNDDLLLCYSNSKKVCLWSMKSESILSSTNKSVVGLAFSEDGSEIMAIVEYPSSVVVYKTNQFDKPFFQHKFLSMFTPKAVYITNTNTLLVGCYDTIYFIDPDKNIVKSIYKTNDGSCSYITYHDSKLFVVFNRIASNEYKTTCVELKLSFNGEVTIEKIDVACPVVTEIETYNFAENVEWYIETPKGEKYIALSGWRFSIYYIDRNGKMEKAYELDSMIERTFVSGNNSIAGIVLRKGEETTVKTMLLDQNVKQINEYKETDYVYYAAISGSGHYLLLPHSKNSKVIQIMQRQGDG